MDTVIESVAAFIQGAGAFVISVSAARALVIYLWSSIVARGEIPSLERVRLDLGRGLVLGLEFLIGADILRSIVAPTWEDIAILAAIIAIRTVLSLSIEFELGRAQASQSQRQQSG